MSDTTPLNYLLLIGSIEILPKLYATVIMPPQVVAELRHSGAPSVVRAWANALPEWITVEEADEARFPNLDAGEAAALALAVDLQVPLLVDEARERAVARSLGVPAVGTVGLIVEAHRAGHLDFEDAIRKLRATNFRIGEEVVRALRHRIQEV